MNSTVIVLPKADARQRYFEMPGLETTGQQDGETPPRIAEQFAGYLGVDVGSTSTKAVIVDESGSRVMVKTYLMTAGKPVDAVKQVFRNLLQEGADKARIAGVGVTGSRGGRGVVRPVERERDVLLDLVAGRELRVLAGATVARREAIGGLRA